MESTGVGTAIMLALAALLWLAYLVPSWFRRREYLATERNAVRLQQTLRIMAEAAEVPQEVRAETTARSAAAHQRMLREQQRRAEAIEKARAAAAARADARRIAVEEPALTAVLARQAAGRRLRRTRAVLSLLLLTAVVVAVAQLLLMGTTRLAPGAWGVLAGSGMLAVLCLAGLSRLAVVGRSRASRRVVEAPPAQARPRAPMPQERERPVREWTPVPVPKPLYLSKPATQKASPTADLVAELRLAELERRRALAAAHAEPEVVPINAEVQSRFARMGIIEPTEGAPAPDLDAVLRRRRASAG